VIGGSLEVDGDGLAERQRGEGPTASKETRKGEERGGINGDISRNRVGAAGSPRDDLCMGDEERSVALHERNRALGSGGIFQVG
jgi:hypothetical protein